MTRSGEIRFARWEEFDLDKWLWNIPASRMKNGYPHTVPLSDRAFDIIKQVERSREGDFVFPGSKPGKALS